MAGANGNGSSPTGGPAAPRVGERAPEIRLVDLDGDKVEMTELRGSECALLFFNPACGFCRAMVDDLRALEAAPPAAMPRLVVVSTGATEVNRELGLRSLVLDDGLAAQAFGVAGTPMAIRLDAEGRITSQLAAGADAVLTLLRGERRVAGPSVAGEPRG
jgi:hypothetical protein